MTFVYIKIVFISSMAKIEDVLDLFRKIFVF